MGQLVQGLVLGLAVAMALYSGGLVADARPASLSSIPPWGTDCDGAPTSATDAERTLTGESGSWQTDADGVGTDVRTPNRFNCSWVVTCPTPTRGVCLRITGVWSSWTYAALWGGIGTTGDLMNTQLRLSNDDDLFRCVPDNSVVVHMYAGGERAGALVEWECREVVRETDTVVIGDAALPLHAPSGRFSEQPWTRPKMFNFPPLSVPEDEMSTAGRITSLEVNVSCPSWLPTIEYFFSGGSSLRAPEHTVRFTVHSPGRTYVQMDGERNGLSQSTFDTSARRVPSPAIFRVAGDAAQMESTDRWASRLNVRCIAGGRDVCMDDVTRDVALEPYKAFALWSDPDGYSSATYNDHRERSGCTFDLRCPAGYGLVAYHGECEYQVTNTGNIQVGWLRFLGPRGAASSSPSGGDWPLLVVITDTARFNGPTYPFPVFDPASFAATEPDGVPFYRVRAKKTSIQYDTRGWEFTLACLPLPSVSTNATEVDMIERWRQQHGIDAATSRADVARVMTDDALTTAFTYNSTMDRSPGTNANSTSKLVRKRVRIDCTETMNMMLRFDFAVVNRQDVIDPGMRFSIKSRNLTSGAIDDEHAGVDFQPNHAKLVRLISSPAMIEILLDATVDSVFNISAVCTRAGTVIPNVGLTWQEMKQRAGFGRTKWWLQAPDAEHTVDSVQQFMLSSDRDGYIYRRMWARWGTTAEDENAANGRVDTRRRLQCTDPMHSVVIKKTWLYVNVDAYTVGFFDAKGNRLLSFDSASTSDISEANRPIRNVVFPPGPVWFRVLGIGFDYGRSMKFDIELACHRVVEESSNQINGGLSAYHETTNRSFSLDLKKALADQAVADGDVLWAHRRIHCPASVGLGRVSMTIVPSGAGATLQSSTLGIVPNIVTAGAIDSYRPVSTLPGVDEPVELTLPTPVDVYAYVLKGSAHHPISVAVSAACQPSLKTTGYCTHRPDVLNRSALVAGGTLGMDPNGVSAGGIGDHPWVAVDCAAMAECAPEHRPVVTAASGDIVPRYAQNEEGVNEFAVYDVADDFIAYASYDSQFQSRTANIEIDTPFEVVGTQLQLSVKSTVNEIALGTTGQQPAITWHSNAFTGFEVTYVCCPAGVEMETCAAVGYEQTTAPTACPYSDDLDPQRGCTVCKDGRGKLTANGLHPCFTTCAARSSCFANGTANSSLSPVSIECGCLCRTGFAGDSCDRCVNPRHSRDHSCTQCNIGRTGFPICDEAGPPTTPPPPATTSTAAATSAEITSTSVATGRPDANGTVMPGNVTTSSMSSLAPAETSVAPATTPTPPVPTAPPGPTRTLQPTASRTLLRQSTPSLSWTPLKMDATAVGIVLNSIDAATVVNQSSGGPVATSAAAGQVTVTIGAGSDLDSVSSDWRAFADAASLEAMIQCVAVPGNASDYVDTDLPVSLTLSVLVPGFAAIVVTPSRQRALSIVFQRGAAFVVRRPCTVPLLLARIECRLHHGIFAGPPIDDAVARASFAVDVTMQPVAAKAPVVAPALLEGTTTSVAVAATAGAVASAGPSAAQAARSRALIDLAECDFEYGEPLDAMIHPLGFAVGDSPVRYHIGAMLGNPVLVAGCFLGQMLLVFGVFALPPVRRAIVRGALGADESTGAPDLSTVGMLSVVRGAARQPSLAFIVMLFFFQDSIAVTVTVMAHSGNAGYIVLASLVLLGWLAVPGAAFYVTVWLPLRTGSGALGTQRRFSSVYRIAPDLGSGRSILRNILLGVGEWEDGVGEDDPFPGYLVAFKRPKSSSDSGSGGGLSSALLTPSGGTDSPRGITVGSNVNSRSAPPMSREAQLATEHGCGAEGLPTEGGNLGWRGSSSEAGSGQGGAVAPYRPRNAGVAFDRVSPTGKAANAPPPSTSLLRDREMGFTNRYDAVFCAYRPTRRWFIVVELLMIFVSGIISGVQPGEEACGGVYWAMLSAFSFYFLAVVFLLPYHTVVEQVFGVLLAAVQLAAAIVLVFDIRTVAGRVALAAMFLSVLKGLLDMGFLAFDFGVYRLAACCKRACGGGDDGVDAPPPDEVVGDGLSYTTSHQAGRSAPSGTLASFPQYAASSNSGALLGTVPQRAPHDGGGAVPVKAHRALPAGLGISTPVPAEGALPSASAILASSEQASSYRHRGLVTTHSDLSQAYRGFTTPAAANAALALGSLRTGRPVGYTNSHAPPPAAAATNPLTATGGGLRFAPPQHSPVLEAGADRYGFRHL